ncbi:aerobic respiration control sensor protein ArcB [Vibrio sp. JCM 18905]|nr:aerobic respiration control sensor protein ArcB [Vibrio sp. JCM 18905]
MKPMKNLAQYYVDLLVKLGDCSFLDFAGPCAGGISRCGAGGGLL